MPSLSGRTRHRPPPLPYDPHREFEEEAHVLVFRDVPPSDWRGEPQPIRGGIAAWLGYVEVADRRRDELRRMPYEEYLQTPEWLALRKLVKHRANHRCEHCGATDSEWNVHHLTYERRGFEDLSDLVLLCRKCHEIAHGIADH